MVHQALQVSEALRGLRVLQGVLQELLELLELQGLRVRQAPQGRLVIFPTLSFRLKA